MLGSSFLDNQRRSQHDDPLEINPGRWLGDDPPRFSLSSRAESAGNVLAFSQREPPRSKAIVLNRA
jgi:hypothetical protein